MLPEKRDLFNGWERADSIVVNPHKWLFTPFDLSVLYCRDLGVLKNAFSLVPEYLKTSEESTVKNGMDYGIQLGRRFRALKLWFVIRYFGREGLIAWVRSGGTQVDPNSDEFKAKSAKLLKEAARFPHG